VSQLERYRVQRISQRSRFQRMLEAVRSYTLGPWSTKDPALARYFGGAPVSAGVSVNEQTALTYSAVWAAVHLISSHIAGVPLPLYKRLPNGGKERFTKHPLYRLMHDQPNPRMGSMVFRRTLQAHKLVWGNGYAEIARNTATGQPVALWPLLPYAVEPFYEGGLLRYRVHNPTRPPSIFNPSDILHIKGDSEDGIFGYSVIQRARESIGLGMAAERFGSTFFGNGSTFGGVISWPQGVNPQSTAAAKKGFMEAIEAQHQGVDKAHRFLALYEGAKYERLGIPPNDAQFLETRQFQIEEICRWFNLPPHKLKHLERSTNNNIEHQGIEYVTDTLDPEWVIWEQELDLKLVSPLERTQQFYEHVREGLLRGDAQARGEFYSKLFSLGAMSPNEIRQRENLNPVDGGDTVYVPLNTIPLNRLDEYLDAQIKAKEAPKAPPQAPQGNPDRAEVETLTQELALARRKAQEWEDIADREKQAHAQARADLVAAEKTLETTGQALNTVTQQRDLLGAELLVKQDHANLLMTERDAARESVAKWTKRVDDVVAERDDALAERDNTSETWSNLIAEEQARIEALTADATAAQEARARAELVRDDLVKERDELASRLIAADAALAEARTLLAELSAKERAAINERDILSDDIDTLQKDIETLTTERDTVKDAERTRRTILLSAMRGVMVDTAERLLQREADRARKAQATPEKLRRWVETFYPLHADVVRATWRPVVTAWVALTEQDGDVLLERLVAGHVEQSITAIRQVADVDEPDQMAAALERTLRRWETERAGAVADGLIREGMQR
jgi:HK97 family phage portal protein